MPATPKKPIMVNIKHVLRAFSFTGINHEKIFVLVFIQVRSCLLQKSNFLAEIPGKDM